MDVLLIGATGYIGRAVAGALQAVGHRIHGLARSDQAARTLWARGMTPVLGDLQDPSGLEAALARSARDEGVARYPGSGDNRWPLVHIDDLAALYRIVLECAPSGELIFGGENDSASVRSMAEAAGRAAGTDGQTAPWSSTEARKILGPYADVLSLDQHISGGCRWLGWRPTGPSVIEELEHGSYSRPMR